jgi:hypothetical protein
VARQVLEGYAETARLAESRRRERRDQIDAESRWRRRPPRR